MMLCGFCGTSNTEGIAFCAACGRPLAPAAGPPAPAAPAAPRPAAPAGLHQRTVFGMPAPRVAAPEPSAPPATVPAPPPAPAPSPLPASPFAAPFAAQGAPPPAAPAPAAPSAKKTMLGMPGVAVPAVPAPAPSPVFVPTPPTPDPRPPTPELPAAEAIPSAKRTMLGVTSPAAPAPAPSPVFVPTPPTPELLSAKRTMLGVAAPVSEAPVPSPVFVPTPPTPDPRPPTPAPAFVPQQPAFYGPPPGAGPSWADEAPAARKSRAGLVVALTLGILAVAGVVAAVVFRQEIFGDEARTAAGAAEAGSAAAAAAASARIGAKLAFSPDGSDVRLVFGAIESERPVREILLAVGPSAGTPAAVVQPGKEAPVADLLPAGGSLAPGTLEVPLDVVYADGAVERVEAALAVPYTFRASVKDGGTVPVLRIEFRVVPGTALEAAGAPVEVSADGSAAYEVPVESLRDREGAWKESENHVDVSVAFAAIGPGGERADGSAALQVPITKLRVDFPPREALTTEATVWVRGETAPGAALALDGAPIAVNPNGTFAVEVPLVEGATPRAITLAARLPGSLERRATVTVTRLAPEDLLARAREYEAGIADRLGYSDFAAAASSFVGRRVRLKGTVRSTPEMRGGTVTFVLFVDTASGCPRRAVCAVLVQAATAVPIAERSVVRVLGEIAGARVTTSADFPELPAVRAEFVLPGG